MTRTRPSFKILANVALGYSTLEGQILSFLCGLLCLKLIDNRVPQFFIYEIVGNYLRKLVYVQFLLIGLLDSDSC